jgi:two-component system OmpR family sensor kinase
MQRALATAPHSLRTRLLAWLLAAIALTAAVQAAVAYRTARREADAIFDYHMQQAAQLLRAGVPFDSAAESDAAPLAAPRKDENFEFVVQIDSLDGEEIYRSARGAELPPRTPTGFSDQPAHGSTYRVFTVQTPEQVIQVAQDLAVRRRMAGTLALRTVAPVVLGAPLLMLVAWWVVGRSLVPVQHMRRQLAERRADDLTPVGEAGLPDEVGPLVHELNALFGRLRSAFDAQQHFVADAAHELRSPLAALRLQVQALRRAADDAARERAITRLSSGIDRATRLVEQLLALARQHEGATAGAPPQPLALGAVVRRTVEQASAEAQARGIDLGLGETAEAMIDGHEEALQILLRNLLDNALKHTPRGGTIDVELRATVDGVVLRVEDSGPGVPEAERARVLDRFYRVPGTEPTGSGLGLAIVKAIAERHGASLRLEHSPRLGGLAVELRFMPAARPFSVV